MESLQALRSNYEFDPALPTLVVGKAGLLFERDDTLLAVYSEKTNKNDD